MNKEKQQTSQYIKNREEILPYVRRLERETKISFHGPEPLAHMDYQDELRAKDRAFSAYWNDITARCSAGAIIPSPMPRKYRTTTKRRIHKTGSGVILSSDESGKTDKPSLLEPDSHSAIYRELGVLLNSPVNRNITKLLNFVILRGDYEHHAIIFNVKKINSDTVTGFTITAEKIKQNHPALQSAFLFLDPVGSKYYLNTSAEVDGMRLKRLFGNRMISLRAGGITYRYYPDGFSQVNLSICDRMLETAAGLLENGDGRLIDLYSGYGFFSCYLASHYRDITGIDFAGSSIDSARENMKMLKTGTRWTFHARRIDVRTLKETLPEPGGPESVILDPPRNGTAPGVIAAVAGRSPELVLHIFCGVETIPGDMALWKRSGYEPVKCIPLDMFPGTPDVEVMVLLKRVQPLKKSPQSKSGRRVM